MMTVSYPTSLYPPVTSISAIWGAMYIKDRCTEVKITPVWKDSLRCRTPGRCHSLCCIGTSPMRANPSGESGWDHCPVLECIHHKIQPEQQTCVDNKERGKCWIFHFHSWIPVTIALWSSNKNIIVCRIRAEYWIWQARIKWWYHRGDKMCALSCCCK